MKHFEIIRYFEILKSTKLFMSIGHEELESIVNCIGGRVKNVQKGEILLMAGDKPENIGIVLDGQLHILHEDYEGNRSLMAVLTPGEIFAETLCCAGVSKSPVTVTADTDSAVMLIPFLRILHTCPNSCSFHTRLTQNMLELIAQKNLRLQARMEIISLKSIRAKVLRYLESFIPSRNREITIPFNREELADFLCVERSALSHELSRMKQDGLIEYKKNNFILKIR